MTAQQYMVPLYRLELVRERDIPYQSVNTIEAAAEVFHEMLDSSPIEKMACIHVTSGGKMIGAEIVAIGSMEAVGAAMSDLFRGAIKNNAARIWMAHNHVDGNVRASPQDYGYTLRVLEASRFLGVDLIDHLVIGPGGHYSIYSHRQQLQEEFARLERQTILQGLLGGLVPPRPEGF